jgi:hypothetical protein
VAGTKHSSLELVSETVTVRVLIEQRVRHEVEDHNQTSEPA